MKKPTIAVTMGDPAGVGPEICLRLLQQRSVSDSARCVIFGNAAILHRCGAQLGISVEVPVLTHPEGAVDWQKLFAQSEGHAILDIQARPLGDMEPGIVNAATGAAAFAYVEKSIKAALAGGIDAVTTGPIHKEALHAAGIDFPGHTEIFATRTGVHRFCMFQYSSEVRASFVTVHTGYAQVPHLLSVERIVDVIELTVEAMRRIRKQEPKIVVLGLNPHAGEHGLFGDREEERIIAPAVELARQRGYAVEGPIPPDTAFIPSKRRSTDAFVCMYHDQGHIPLKALCFDSAVNTTLGLPIIRTSVDHGTACDIAWKGVADPGSLIQAVLLAARLVPDHRLRL